MEDDQRFSPRKYGTIKTICPTCHLEYWVDPDTPAYFYCSPRYRVEQENNFLNMSRDEIMTAMDYQLRRKRAFQKENN